MPVVSAIVICRNEVSYITRCIDAILQQATDTGLEVIVVDGMSTDGTPGLVRSTYGSRVKLLSNAEQYTPHAINAGIREATGEYIAVIGARSITGPGYFSEALTILQNNPAAWCTGGRIIHRGESSRSQSIAAAMSSPAGVGLFNFRTLNSTKETDTVSSPVFRKSIVQQIGFFDESCIRNQDDDFSYRIAQAGGKIVLNGNVFTEYYVRTSWTNLARQYFQYGFWKMYVNRKHKTITSLRQVFPALLLTGLAASLLVPGYARAVLPLIYLGFTALGATAGALVKKCNPLSVMTSIVLMHFAYGLGYLYGTLNFVLLNRPVPAGMKKLTR